MYLLDLTHLRPRSYSRMADSLVGLEAKTLPPMELNVFDFAGQLEYLTTHKVRRPIFLHLVPSFLFVLPRRYLRDSTHTLSSFSSRQSTPST